MPVRDLDIQRWTTDCLHGGMVESLRRTRHVVRRHERRQPLPLVVLNVSQVDAATFAYRFDRRLGDDRFAVQVTLRPRCGYGHYMVAFVTPRRLVLFDPSNSRDCAQGRPVETLRGIFRSHGVVPSLEVLTLPETETCDVRCSIWVAFAYYVVSTSSLARLRAVVAADDATREATLRAFHTRVLDARPTSPPP